MKRLGYSPAALDDLRDIASYIAEDNPDRATSFVDELEQKAALAAKRPESFRDRSDLSPGLRAVRHGRYLIFFRELSEEVRIVRVLHGARNMSGLFEA